MHMHVVRHVPFEGPALIAEWAAQRGFEVTDSLSFTEQYPSLDKLDLLVVLGGPMAADDHAGNPWLAAEKHYLSEALTAGRRVLGICLGAQLIVDVAGGAVRRGQRAEIGFFPVRHTEAAVADSVLSAFPDGLVVGHWHGDTFDVPPDASTALSSEVTPNQAFTLNGGRVVALQFHLEWTREALMALIDGAADELGSGGPYVWSASALLDGIERYEPACREALWGVLDRMTTIGEEGR
jgi:GMP synthase-like glutamine amidotransferase